MPATPLPKPGDKVRRHDVTYVVLEVKEESGPFGIKMTTITWRFLGGTKSYKVSEREWREMMGQ
jgi:hypothetical protein